MQHSRTQINTYTTFPLSIQRPYTSTVPLLFIHVALVLLLCSQQICALLCSLRTPQHNQLSALDICANQIWANRKGKGINVSKAEQSLHSHTYKHTHTPTKKGLTLHAGYCYHLRDAQVIVWKVGTIWMFVVCALRLKDILYHMYIVHKSRIKGSTFIRASFPQKKQECVHSGPGMLNWLIYLLL